MLSGSTPCLLRFIWPIQHRLASVRPTRPCLRDHPEIETPLARKTLYDIVATKPQAKLEAWHSRLRDDDLSGADAKPVANLHVVLPQAFGREILAEHAPRQRRIRKLAMPIRVVFRRVSVDCLVPAAVHRQVSLTISIQIEEPQGDPIGNRRLEDRGRNGLALPLHRAGKPQIDRDDLHRRSCPGSSVDAAWEALICNIPDNAKRTTAGASNATTPLRRRCRHGRTPRGSGSCAVAGQAPSASLSIEWVEKYHQIVNAHDDENGEIVVPDCVRVALRPLVGQIDGLDEAIGAIDKEIAASVKADETIIRRGVPTPIGARNL